MHFNLTSEDLNFSDVTAVDTSGKSAIRYVPDVEIISVSPSNEQQKEKIVRLVSLDINDNKSLITVMSKRDNPCPQYWNIVSYAEHFVADIIDEAEGLINQHMDVIPAVTKAVSMERVIQRYSSDYPLIEYNRPQFAGWPTIEEFTIALGADKIDEYLASFNTNEEWLYIIYYLGDKIDFASKYYKYEATWSLPIPEYPIAQATASVFFTIEVSDVLPSDCLVDVTFSFESHRFKHKPGLTDFVEEFLNYVLDSKIGVFKKIKF